VTSAPLHRKYLMSRVITRIGCYRMARGARQRSLSIFLLKEDVASFRNAVRDADAVEWHDVTAASRVRGAVAVRSPIQKRPWWTGYVGAHLESSNALDRLANASTAALVFVDSAKRYFAVAFGYGRHLLSPDAYEQDFGLKVVLNTVEPDRLTSVDARTFDELTMHTRRDLNRGSSFAAFGLDVSRDLVRAVTGPPRDHSLGSRASGADALALVTGAQFGELPALCKRLLVAYGADDYKERFAWIDHLRRVRESSVVERLTEVLLQALLLTSESHVTLSYMFPGLRCRVFGCTAGVAAFPVLTSLACFLHLLLFRLRSPRGHARPALVAV